MKITNNRLFLDDLIALVLAFAVCLLPQHKAYATAGMAEFTVDTPGGNKISNCPRPNGGEIFICLYAGGVDPTKEIVRGVKRWRYYEGFVAIETSYGFSLIHEHTKESKRFQTEQQLTEFLETRKPAGKELSSWMTSADAMEEIWYPVTTWGFCRWKAGKLKVSEKLAEFYKTIGAEYAGDNSARCKKIDDPSVRALQIRTTLGNACRAARKPTESEETSPMNEIRDSFCTELLGSSVPPVLFSY